MSFDSKHQQRLNGPLTPELKDRIEAIRSARRISLALIAKPMGISGPFLSSLLRDGSVRSIHLPRLLQGLANLEQELGLGTNLADAGDDSDANAPAESERQPEIAVDREQLGSMSIEDLIREAHKRGFEIAFRPLSR